VSVVSRPEDHAQYEGERHSFGRKSSEELNIDSLELIHSSIIKRIRLDPRRDKVGAANETYVPSIYSLNFLMITEITLLMADHTDSQILLQSSYHLFFHQSSSLVQLPPECDATVSTCLLSRDLACAHNPKNAQQL
jgi:hypothetical protein